MKSSTWLAILAATLIAGWLETSVRAATGGQRSGTVQMITVHGKSLEGNLEGDSPDREVYVYLPPSYATEKSRRYPVLYFLHGYGAKPELYWKMMTVPATADKLMGEGTRPRIDSGVSGRAHDLRRQHVFELADHRRLGDLHHARPGEVHRQPLPHHRESRQPRAGRAFDGRLRNAADRHEVSRGLLQHLRHEFLLPHE